MEIYNLSGGEYIDLNTNQILNDILKDIKIRPQRYSKFFKHAGIDMKQAMKMDGYRFMELIRKKFVKIDVRLYSTTDDELKRAYKIALNINKYLGDFIMRKGKTYLDYGCSNGVITRALSAFYGLDDLDVFGAEIKYWSGRKNDCGVNMIYIDPDDYRINIDDNFFDLITAFHVLHHCKNNDKLAKELVRILKPGGRLILREHDLNKTISKAYLDLQHLKFSVNENKGKELENYFSNYRPEEEWYKIIGLRIVKIEKYPNDMEVFTTVFEKKIENSTDSEGIYSSINIEP